MKLADIIQKLKQAQRGRGLLFSDWTRALSEVDAKAAVHLEKLQQILHEDTPLEKVEVTLFHNAVMAARDGGENGYEAARPYLYAWWWIVLVMSQPDETRNESADFN